MMLFSKQIAKHLNDVYFGGNWTWVNIKDTLADVTWVEATAKLHDLNTIATLVFHINYYIEPVLKVLQEQPLQASDKNSFNMPPITSDEDWQQLKTSALTAAEKLIAQIEQLDDAVLFETFADTKYGSYYRNLHGLIEHTHYHLGQIAIIKKILRSR